ncbi:hypothetical protein PMI42_00745 [Bradyrhizobium sp. YR681]|uniref:hypothetical protein n=1 Tax=Bradyrhizobium sp. YR681 TaxID=1144344 RepID=UPI000270E6A5|nr:hypothetical protein [Bradyrhizobium sp. YR681]EJN15727.1 hypothetical protein PMI42_00745 [Bradyrhizobium sp. YR681]
MGTRANQQHPGYFLRLLKFSPFERAPRGGWRFGTRRIGDAVVARLVASGRAEIRGEQLIACQRQEGER